MIARAGAREEERKNLEVVLRFGSVLFFPRSIFLNAVAVFLVLLWFYGGRIVF